MAFRHELVRQVVLAELAPHRALFLHRIVMFWLLSGWVNRPVLSQFTPAGIIAVTQSGDSGPGSLRAAILEANSLPGPDQISVIVTGTL